MDDLLLLARWVLALTFSVAGLAKLNDLRAFTAGLANLGIPRALHRAVGTALPYAELAIAVGLLWSATAWAASVGALGLLVLFTALIAHHLLQGRRPACNCFGQAKAAPISPLTLARNVGLTAAASAVVSAGPDAGQTAWLNLVSSMQASGATMVILLLFLCGLLAFAGWMLFQLMAQQGRLMLRIDNLELRLSQRGDTGLVPAGGMAPQGLEVGTLAPRFSAALMHHGEGSLQSLLRAGLPVVLVFSDPDCGPCQLLAPRLVRWERELAGRLTIALVSRGDTQQNLKKFGAEHLKHVFLQVDRELANQFKVFATPSAVRISSAGLIDSHLALADLAIDELVHEAQPADAHATSAAASSRSPVPERQSMA